MDADKTKIHLNHLRLSSLSSALICGCLVFFHFLK